MRGYPRFLNSKVDYEYVKMHFPKYKWLPNFQELVDDYKKWMKEEKLAKEGDGVINATSKVVEEENEEKEKIYYQYRFKIDPNCRIRKLGMEIKELTDVLEDPVEII